MKRKNIIRLLVLLAFHFPLLPGEGLGVRLQAQYKVVHLEKPFNTTGSETGALVVGDTVMVYSSMQEGGSRNKHSRSHNSQGPRRSQDLLSHVPRVQQGQSKVEKSERGDALFYLLSRGKGIEMDAGGLRQVRQERIHASDLHTHCVQKVSDQGRDNVRVHDQSLQRNDTQTRQL